MPLIRNSLAEAGHNQTSLPKNNSTDPLGSIIGIIKEIIWGIGLEKHQE